MQAFLFFFVCVCASQKRGITIPGIPSGDRGNWGYEYCNVTNNIQKFSRVPCMFCEESLGKINVKDDKLFRTGRSRNSIA